MTASWFAQFVAGYRAASRTPQPWLRRSVSRRPLLQKPGWGGAPMSAPDGTLTGVTDQFYFHPDGCIVDPAAIDWSKQSDGSVVTSAQAGTAEAVAELARRRVSRPTLGVPSA